MDPESLISAMMVVSVFELQRETLFISLEALTEPKFIDMEILKL